MKALSILAAVLVLLIPGISAMQTPMQTMSAANSMPAMQTSGRGDAQQYLNPDYLKTNKYTSAVQVKAQYVSDPAYAAAHGYDPSTGMPLDNPYATSVSSGASSDASDAIVLLHKRAAMNAANQGHRIKTAVETRTEQQENYMGTTMKLRQGQQERMRIWMSRRMKRPSWYHQMMSSGAPGMATQQSMQSTMGSHMQSASMMDQNNARGVRSQREQMLVGKFLTHNPSENTQQNMKK